MDLEARDRLLDQRIGELSCTTREDARLLVRFALRCVQVAPLSNPEFAKVVRLTEQWLAGESVAEQLEAIGEGVQQAAATHGPYSENVAGPAAAAWAVADLHEALRIALASEVDSTQLQGLVEMVRSTAQASRKSFSTSGLTRGALVYQEMLCKTLFAN
jgi:hypothetical protein